MGRFMRLLRWELDSPLVVLIFFVGLILGFAMVHRAGLSVAVGTGGVYTSTSGSSGLLQVLSEVGYAFTPTGRVLVGDLRVGFGVYTFMMILLGSLIFRWDRDSGYAPILYSLPYSKSKVFVAKFAAFLLLSLLMYLLPCLFSVFPSNADIPGVVLSILSSERALKALVLALYAILYTVSITAFVASVLPGLFPTIIGAFFLVAISSNLFPGTLPPFSFITVPLTSQLSPLEARFFVPGVVLPVILFLLGVYAFERRDVV
ncbi:hypothetical protein [Thermococcus sp.]|uniref:hypothetical protein n=1 Tax=Thermococcus sp. TaxID=35749 RepID=UPI00263724E0|nr:hypothetical protein [Thermococcus sp.]